MRKDRHVSTKHGRVKVIFQNTNWVVLYFQVVTSQNVLQKGYVLNLAVVENYVLNTLFGVSKSLVF